MGGWGGVGVGGARADGMDVCGASNFVHACGRIVYGREYDDT